MKHCAPCSTPTSVGRLLCGLWFCASCYVRTDRQRASNITFTRQILASKGLLHDPL